MAKVNTARFKQLAPRMMRDLMRDFAPLADFHAAGITGNGGGESGGFTIAQEGAPIRGRGGWGGFQWTGPRRVAYEKWLRDHGRNPADPNAALDYDMMYGFLKHELQTSERATIPAVRKTTNLSDATREFMRVFERPGIPHIEGRIAWSKMALDAYKAEQGQITKNPPIVEEIKKGNAPLPVPKIDVNAPADGVPKPKENNKGFWATILGLGASGAAATWNFALEWLPLLIGIGGLIVLLIFMFRPVYVRWRDYLRHAPEFVELAQTRPLQAVGVLFDGFKAKVVGRATQGISALLVLVQGASSIAGAGEGFGLSLDNILPSFTLPIGKEGIKIVATQYLFGLTFALGWLQNKFRDIAKSSSGTISAATAVDMAASSQSMVGSVPSPALAAVTDTAALAELVSTPSEAPKGIDSSTLIGEEKVLPKKARVRRVAKRKPGKGRGEPKAKRRTPAKRKGRR